MAKEKSTYTQDDRMEFYKPHDKVTLPESLLDHIHIRNMGGFENFDVWLVDGEVVRDSVDVDFVEGGNPGRYVYVPEGEIWIEKNLSEKDYLATLVHEWYEALLMQKDGMSYSDAHDEAVEIEKDIRKEIQLQHKNIMDL